MTNFLQTPDKFFSKKRRQINKNKIKTSIEEINSRTTIINNLASFDKKKLLVPLAAIKKSKPKTKILI